MISSQAIERVLRKPTRRSPVRLTQTPVIRIRSAVPITLSAATRQTPAPGKAPANAMIIVASSMNADSRSSRAAPATRQGPGR